MQNKISKCETRPIFCKQSELKIKLCSIHQIPWCSTKTNSKGDHVKGNYGNCECDDDLDEGLDEELGSSFVDLREGKGGSNHSSSTALKRKGGKGEMG